MIRQILNKTSRIARSVNQIPKNTFCMYQAYLNPEKHINMGHNVNNVYEDIVMLGDFLLPNKLNYAEVSNTYVPKLLHVTFNHLNKKYNLQLNEKNYEEYYTKHWSEIGVQDIESDKIEILEQLSKNVFVKDHKLRWVAEQKQRLGHTQEVYSYLQLDQYYVGYFFESYNILLQNSIERSHLWQSKDVRGELSSLERSIEDNIEPATGVDSLDNIAPENDNLINRLMKVLHKQ